VQVVLVFALYRMTWWQPLFRKDVKNGSPFAKGSGVSKFRTWGRDAARAICAIVTAVSGGNKTDNEA
jgi:hypothetical protein